MTYSITWTCGSESDTQTFDSRNDFISQFKQLSSDSTCTITQYVNGAARYDINDAPVIADVI